MESKTKQPSTATSTRKKIASYDYYMDLAFKTKPISLTGLELLAEDLIKWALNEDGARKIRPFFNSKGITSRDINRWKKRSKKFRHAYEIAKAAIGDRREDGALIKKLDPSIVIKSMHHYDDDWKKIDNWNAELRKKAEADDKPTNITVNMTSYKEEDDEKRENEDGSG